MHCCIIFTRSVHDVCQGNQRNVSHIVGSIVERVPDAVEGLHSISLDSPVEGSSGAQNPRPRILKEMSESNIFILNS